MITIIHGIPKVGKTGLMTYLALLLCFSYDKQETVKNERHKLIKEGYKVANDGFLYSDYKIRFDNGLDVIKSKDIDVKKDLRLRSGAVVPGAVICIEEGQEYFDARRFKNLDRDQSAFFEMHGHIKADIFIDVQRFDLIDLNIRAISRSIEILSSRIEYDQFGFFRSMTWRIRESLPGHKPTDKTIKCSKFNILNAYNAFDKAKYFFSEDKNKKIG